MLKVENGPYFMKVLKIKLFRNKEMSPSFPLLCIRNEPNREFVVASAEFTKDVKIKINIKSIIKS